MIKKTKLRNVETYAFPNRESFLDYINEKQKILVAVNAEKILKDESKLYNIINENIGYADGVGAVMALKQKGLDAIKIPGAEFWIDIVKKFKEDKTFYLMGSEKEVIEKTVEKLQKEIPKVKIVGYRDGYLGKNDKKKLIAELKVKKPDVVFIAQGTPRQEYLMDELIKEHPALYMGLGGSFDVYCGFKNRAPKIFIDLQLEWLYRLLKEPTRIGRQLVYIKFLILLKAGRL